MRFNHSVKNYFLLFVYIFMQGRRFGHWQIRVEKVKTMPHCLFPNYSVSYDYGLSHPEQLLRKNDINSI